MYSLVQESQSQNISSDNIFITNSITAQFIGDN